VHRGSATPCSTHHRSYDRWVPCVSLSRFCPTVIQISAIQSPPRRDWRRPPCARSPPPRSLRPQSAARTPLLHSRPAPPSSLGSPHGRRSSLSGTGVAPPSHHPTAASHLTLLVKHSRSPPPGTSMSSSPWPPRASSTDAKPLPYSSTSPPSPSMAATNANGVILAHAARSSARMPLQQRRRIGPWSTSPSCLSLLLPPHEIAVISPLCAGSVRSPRIPLGRSASMRLGSWSSLTLHPRSQSSPTLSMEGDPVYHEQTVVERGCDI
jgi:hypothetical protein